MSKSDDNFGRIYQEFTFGMSQIPVMYLGHRFEHMNVAITDYQCAYLGGVFPVMVMDVDGVQVPMDRSQIEGYFSAMYNAVKQHHAEYAAKRREWKSDGDNVNHRTGWTFRHSKMVELDTINDQERGIVR